MIMTPSSFSYEHLSSLKFKELQKLSAQFRVNKRWAKKQELIANLLELKERVKIQSNDKEEENEWRDGSVVFSDLRQNSENEVDRRLTFNVNEKSNPKDVDRHMTFILPQNGKNLLGEKINSRETYEVIHNGTDFGVEPLVEARATFEIPPKKELLDDIDPRATFDIPQNGNELLKEAETFQSINESKNIQNSENNLRVDVKDDDVGIKNDTGFDTSKDVEQERNKEGKLQVKMLTIPCARVTRRNRKEASKAESSPIKISKKSINIKKSTRLPIGKSNLIKSPALSSVKKSMPKQTIIQSLVGPQFGKITHSKVPVRLQFNEEKQRADKGKGLEKIDGSNKENMKKTLMRRISKTTEETLKKNSTSTKGNFKVQPIATTKTPARMDLTGKLSAGAALTPGCKSAMKSNFPTKMPDFSKIHKRHFEQMDSLPDYLKKKEERVRKLFGVPQPGQQLQTPNKSTPVFRFQSVALDKENKESAIKQKQKESKTPQKEAFKSKLPPSKLRIEMKEENRSRIQGVRTNKRFELQMKLRNM